MPLFRRTPEKMKKMVTEEGEQAEGVESKGKSVEGLKKETTPIETEEERKRKIQEVREELEAVTGEKKVEKGKFEALLEFAQKEIGEEKPIKTIEKRGVIDFEEVKIPGGWEEWGEGEQEKAQRNAARMSGYVNYYLIANPEIRKWSLEESKKSYYKGRKENLITKWNSFGLEKIDPELKDSFSKQLFDVLNQRVVRLSMGSGSGWFVLNPKQEVETFSVSTPLVSKTEDYIPVLRENIQRKINEIRRSIEDEEKLKRVLEDCQEGANLHIGTFGKAALKEGDLIPAIDAFGFTGELKNPEIAGTLLKQMEELKKSGTEKDRELLKKASKRVLEISGKEE